jgi:hypothetical protein
MHNSRAYPVLLAAVLFLFCTVAHANDSVRLTRKVDLVPTDQRIAYCPENGTILVTFTQFDVDDPNFARVWAVLMVPKNDGTYKAKRARMISPDAGWHGRARPIYVADRGQFLIVWDNGGTSGAAASQIFGRWVRVSNGKPKGGAFKIIEGQRNVFPMLMALDGSGFQPTPAADGDPFALLLFTTYLIEPGVSPTFFGDPRTYSLFFYLDGNKDIPRLESKHEILRGELFNGTALAPFITGGGAAPIDFDEYPQFVFGATLLGERHVYYNNRFTSRSLITTLAYDRDGAPTSFGLTEWDPDTVLAQKASLGVMLDPVVQVRYATLTFDRNQERYRSDVVGHPVLGDTPSISTFFNQFKKKTEETQLVIMLEPYVVSNFDEEAEPPAKEAFSYLLGANSDGWVYQRKVVESGKPSGGVRKLFRHDGDMQSMIAQYLFFTQNDESPEVQYNTVVVWQRKLDEKNHELRAFFYNVN